MDARLVHTNSLKTHIVGGLGAWMAGRPLVWHVRDLLGEGEGLGLMRRAARMLRPHIIAISQAVGSQFAGLPVAVTVIPNGIPVADFAPGDPPPNLRRELGLTATDQVVMVVSRLTPWKGHMTLLEALSLLAESWPQLKLVVVGEVAFWEPEYEQQLKQRAADLGVGARVVWTGFRADVPDLLRLCDLFVLPSLNEPFGRAIVEAMAAGRPVVATRSGGVPEIVVDGETGLLVPPEDSPALAQAMAMLLGDPIRAREMGARGLERARTRFSADRVAVEVQDVYQQLLARRS